MSSDAFYADIGERFDILDGVSMNWGRTYYEQPLRPLWSGVYDGMSRYWGGYYRGARDEIDVLAHMLARVAQEAATPIGDDDRTYDALVRAAGDIRQLDASGRQILETMRRHIGDAALIAITASVRELIRRDRPQPIVMPRGH